MHGRKALILIIFLIISCTAASSVQASEVSLEGEIVQDRFLVPMRGIFEALGAVVGWDGETRTVTGTKGDISVKLTIDSKIANVNGKTVELDVPATIIRDRTYVPTRFVSESLGANVGWDGLNRVAIITHGGTTIRVSEKSPYVGLQHGPGYLPQGFQNSGGWLFDLPDGSEYVYNIYVSQADNQEMIWLNKLTHRDAQGRPYFEVLDTVLLPNPMPGIFNHGLIRDGVKTWEGFVIAKYADEPYFTEIYHAWTLDRGSMKIIKIPVAGIRSENEGYGA